MSDFNIKNEKQLKDLLKIIAEESLRQSLIEVDNTRNYKNQYKIDKKRFGSLSEQEEDAENEVEAETEVADEAETEAPQADSKGDVPVVSFESIKIAINNLRSGRSLKNDDADKNLSAYYERLDDNEKLVLQTFLEQLANIITLSVGGAEAQDPGDPPINIDMTSGEEEADAEAEKDVAETEPSKDKEAVADDDEEDTAPPIDVMNESNKYASESFRRQIRVMMKK